MEYDKLARNKLFHGFSHQLLARLWSPWSSREKTESWAADTVQKFWLLTLWGTWKNTWRLTWMLPILVTFAARSSKPLTPWPLTIHALIKPHSFRRSWCIFVVFRTEGNPGCHDELWGGGLDLHHMWKDYACKERHEATLWNSCQCNPWMSWLSEGLQNQQRLPAALLNPSQTVLAEFVLF